jgi:hypothetical protein
MALDRAAVCVGFWHKTDMPAVRGNVRYCCQSGLAAGVAELLF